MSIGPNPRIYADGFYVQAAPLPASYWATLDLSQYQGVRGDIGGIWYPAAAITIGGAGMGAAGAWQMYNVGAAVITSAGKGVTHGDSDWIQLTGVSRSFEVSIGAMGIDRSVDTVSTAPITPQWGWNTFVDGLKQTPAGGANYAFGARLIVPLDMHHNATLAQVTVNFIVGQSHAGVPASLPMVSVFRVDDSGNVTQLATNAALAGWAGAGFVEFNPTPGSGAAWYDGGAMQSIVWTADAGVIIDNSTYRYFCAIVDEQGTNALAGNSFLSAVPNFSTIPDLRPQ